MAQLPLETVELLKLTLKLYNTIEIDEIIVFTKELQYVGAFNSIDQQTEPELFEDKIDEYRKLIEAVGSNDKKLVNFSSGPNEKYICHVLGKFVVLYRLSSEVGQGSDTQKTI